MRRLAIVIVLTMSGCSDKISSGDCSGNDDCAPGEVCADGACIILCTSDFDCDDGTICQNNVCVTGTRADAPVISSVDGVGPADGATGHAEHLLETHLSITGDNLEGAQVTLATVNGDNYVLEVCEASATALRVKPPIDLPADNYLMTVANQAGDCSTDLSILQGVQGPAGVAGAQGPTGPQGPAGSPDTGTQIVAKINDPATGGVIEAAHIAPNALSGGANMIPDPYFEHGMTHYNLRTADDGTIETVTDAVAGTEVFQNADNETPWIYSNVLIAVEATTHYTVKGSFRRTTTAGSAGTVFLAVLLFDESFNPINGDGTWWFYAVSNLELTDTDWHTFAASFGPGTAHALPTEARFMSAGAVLNYDGATAGNRTYQVTGLGLYAGRQQVDISWQAIHAAAAAACRGSTATGGSGSFANIVRVRNTASAQNCTTICGSNSETCDGEVSVTGFPGKATTNGQQVGRFYNYGCGGSANGGSEATVTDLTPLNDTTGYWSFCCCRP